MPLEVKFSSVFIPSSVRFSAFLQYRMLSSTGARFDDGAGGDNEVQRTMLELINQLDGFDPRGNIKVLMATNRYALSSCKNFKSYEIPTLFVVLV